MLISGLSRFPEAADSVFYPSRKAWKKCRRQALDTRREISTMSVISSPMPYAWTYKMGLHPGLSPHNVMHEHRTYPRVDVCELRATGAPGE